MINQLKKKDLKFMEEEKEYRKKLVEYYNNAVEKVAIIADHPKEYDDYTKGWVAGQAALLKDLLNK